MLKVKIFVSYHPQIFNVTYCLYFFSFLIKKIEFTGGDIRDVANIIGEKKFRKATFSDRAKSRINEMRFKIVGNESI